jgi:hypothetical protein
VDAIEYRDVVKPLDGGREVVEQFLRQAQEARLTPK